jgi:hypothetical protein
MKVVGGTWSGTIFWLIARFGVVYHSREVPCEVGSTNDGVAVVLDHESWRSATSVPSFSAPIDSRCTVDARVAVAVKTCSRVSAALTGRPRSRAAAAARKAGVESALPPNAPPTKGFTTRTAARSSPSASAIAEATRSEPWLPVYSVSCPDSHTATAECGSIAAWFCVAVV